VKMSVLECGMAIGFAAVFTIMCWMMWLLVCHEMQEESERASRRYTVHTAGAVYEDLQRVRSFKHWAMYKKPTGESITFNGNFTEIEQ
jgi:hypothetical protein